MDYFARYFAHFELALAGLIGALISLPWQPELKTRGAKAVFVFSGAACAHYLTPLAVHYLEIQPQSSGSIGFLLGAFGGSLIAAVMRAINQSDLWSIIKTRLPGSNQQ